MSHAPRLNLNKNTLLNWTSASIQEVSRSKKVLVTYLKTLTVVKEMDHENYKISVQRNGENYVLFVISPLKKYYTLLLDNDLRVLLVSHNVKNKFVSKKEKDVRVSLPLKFENGLQFDYGEKLFALIEKNGEKINLQWCHDIPKENGEIVNISEKWIDVEITPDERKNNQQTTYLSESQFILYNPPIKIDGKEWQRVINVTADHYGYWDVKYYLVDCETKKCIDLNICDHYYGFGDNFDAVWIENNQLICYRHSGGDTIEENEQLYPLEQDRVTKMLKESMKSPMCTRFDGENTLAFNLDARFSTTNFIEEINR